MCEFDKNGKTTAECPEAAKKRSEGRKTQADWQTNEQLIAERKRDLRGTDGMARDPVASAKFRAELKILERDQTPLKVRMDQRMVWLEQHRARLVQAAALRRR